MPWRFLAFLDGTGRNHLLAEVVLVLGDRAVPLLDGLLVAHENLLGNLVEETVLERLAIDSSFANMAGGCS